MICDGGVIAADSNMLQGGTAHAEADEFGADDVGS